VNLNQSGNHPCWLCFDQSLNQRQPRAWPS
jgi:hypothetical protein